MRATRIDGAEERVWALHCAGLSLTQIARYTGLGKEHVRAVVTGRWADDRRGA